jgi:hypothetical protein
MSAQLNDLMGQYLVMFDEYPTIIGLFDPEAAIAQALLTGEPIPDTPVPEGTTGITEI